jgi:Rrf2 family protein
MILRLTRQAEYAMRTLLELARAPAGERVETKMIARRQEIPEVFLKKTIQILARAGMIDTRRGSGGGVRLNLPAGLITLADIVEATEGKPAFNPCLAEGENCPNAPHCQIRSAILRGQQAFIAELSKETLAGIVEREMEAKRNHTLRSNELKERRG